MHAVSRAWDRPVGLSVIHRRRVRRGISSPLKKRSAPAPVGLQARQATDSASASRSLVEDPDEAFEAPWTLCPV